MPGSREFTSAALAEIRAGSATVVDLGELAGAPHEEQEAATIAAMAAGADVVIAGVLPRDEQSHRRGRAELLIRHPEGGYSPGIIKFQRALDQRRDDRPFAYSTLENLTELRSGTGWRYRWSWRWANALQLAHLWHLLAAAGFGSATPHGVVIGTERPHCDGLVATWLDLSEPTLAPGPARAIAAGHSDPISALERYQEEFDARVELAQAALSEDGPDPELLQPVVCSECHYCDWWTVCRPLLDDDDLSLRISKSPLDRQEISGLRASGVTTVSQLAEADLEALLPRYLPLVPHRQGAEDRLRLAYRRSRLLSGGLELDRLTSGVIDLPGADIEIDIDIETSRGDRVYLWGFWIADSTGGHYRHFSSFTDLDQDGELALARQAMGWLRDVVAGTDAKVYHYSDYEVVRLQRLAAGGDPMLAWACQFAATGFVDLFDVVRHHFFGANGLGLKAVASAGAGFHWRDEDPGGLNSMTWFDDAVHAVTLDERDQARERVLRYNEDDVRATAELRRWLRGLR